jgi:hypothetical protein
MRPTCASNRADRAFGNRRRSLHLLALGAALAGALALAPPVTAGTSSSASSTETSAARPWVWDYVDYYHCGSPVELVPGVIGRTSPWRSSWPRTPGSASTSSPVAQSRAGWYGSRAAVVSPSVLHAAPAASTRVSAAPHGHWRSHGRPTTASAIGRRGWSTPYATGRYGTIGLGDGGALEGRSFSSRTRTAPGRRTGDNRIAGTGTIDATGGAGRGGSTIAGTDDRDGSGTGERRRQPAMPVSSRGTACSGTGLIPGPDGWKSCGSAGMPATFSFGRASCRVEEKWVARSSAAREPDDRSGVLRGGGRRMIFSCQGPVDMTSDLIPMTQAKPARSGISRKRSRTRLAAGSGPPGDGLPLPITTTRSSTTLRKFFAAPRPARSCGVSRDLLGMKPRWTRSPSGTGEPCRRSRSRSPSRRRRTGSGGAPTEGSRAAGVVRDQLLGSLPRD